MQREQSNIKPIENEYGKMYLSEERAKEYMEIVSKYLREMLIELKEHKLIPCVVALKKTSVYECDDIKEKGEQICNENK